MVDVPLHDNDVALEFDGPYHFMSISGGGEGDAAGDASCTSMRTMRTELRDMFLARRHHAVVSVPWFEWAELSGSMAKTQYIADTLRGAGVHIPAST